MRYLFVTTYPPTHCGIGAYAYQQVLALQEQGHIVNVVSPNGEGNVDFRWDLKGGFRVLKLLRLLPFYDCAMIQYHPAFFYPELGADAGRVSFSFILLFWLCRKKIEIICHEVPNPATQSGHFGSRLYRWKWASCPKVVFHTATERANFLTAYRLPDSDRVELRVHHSQFRRFCNLSRNEARRQLGVPVETLVFLSIGFIQPHKGFDRAMRAFTEAGITDAHYYVVGSLRVASDEYVKHVDVLKAVARTTANVHVVEQFLSDEQFDMWMIASDWIVLPYREIWSSGVLARARLLQRPAIASRVGGLEDQAGGDALFFGDDLELVETFRQVAEHCRELTRLSR